MQNKDPETFMIKPNYSEYTQIFNTMIHMLEDKNMLVFMEAIKTVELLA